MQKLAEICVHRPVFASMLIAAITVVGGVSFFTLGVDRYPRVETPVVSVTTTNPGATPENIETEITDRIEAAVNTVVRHRRAALDLDRGPLARHDLVRPLEERRHRGAGSARQGRSGHPRSPGNRRPAGRAEAGSGFVPDPHVLGVGADAGRRADDVPRAERAEAARVGQRRRRGAALRRAAPRDPGPDRSRSAQRLRALDDRRRGGAARRRISSCPAAGSSRATASSRSGRSAGCATPTPSTISSSPRAATRRSASATSAGSSTPAPSRRRSRCSTAGRR